MRASSVESCATAAWPLALPLSTLLTVVLKACETWLYLPLVAAEGRGILVSVHDLGLAARFCSRLVLLSGGTVLADGTPDAVLSDDNLARGFGVRAQRIDTPDGPVILPYEAI